MKKRIAILLMAVLLAVTGAPTAYAGGNGDNGDNGGSSAAGSSSPFTDVPTNQWYYSYVTDLYQQGVIDGYGNGTFQPDKEVTWGHAFKLILLAIGCDEPAGVAGKHWAYPYIEMAIDERLVYSFNSAHLDAVPTRLEVAQMTARALDLTSISGESPYDDCDDGYVVELYEKGIMNGFGNPDGTSSFRPNKSITRKEMSAIIWRIMNIDVTEGMFRYSNYWLDVLDSVAPFSFTADQFSLDKNGRMTYSGGYYARGIDVSGHKLDIDWEAVAADGIDFAIVRAGNRFYGRNGTGAVCEDSYFHKNMQGALAAGLDVGAYFFSNAITVEEAWEEADLLLSMLEPYHDRVTYPVVCDWEYLGGSESRALNVEPGVITECIAAFCDRVAEAGYTPMIYFNAYCGYIKMDLSKLDQYQFWYAQYAKTPSCVYDFQMWQYSASGKVAGIGSAVDMDICFVPYGQGEEQEPSESEPPVESWLPVESGRLEVQPDPVKPTLEPV